MKEGTDASALSYRALQSHPEVLSYCAPRSELACTQVSHKRLYSLRSRTELPCTKLPCIQVVFTLHSGLAHCVHLVLLSFHHGLALRSCTVPLLNSCIEFQLRTCTHFSAALCFYRAYTQAT